jgi:hypothetical protein
MSTGLSFAEAMVGTWRRTGEHLDRSFRFDARVETPTLPLPFSTVVAELTGTLTAEGMASGTPITGTLEISPFRNHRLRYTFTTVADDGRRYRFDGWKSLRGVRRLRAWTTLPGAICNDDGQEVGTALLRFPLMTFPSFVAGFRLRYHDTGLEERRWSGRAGRLEVWYDTLTDPRTGTGLWLHHEMCAPSDGGGARGYGWLALFPPDGPPEIVRFGPEPLGQGPWFAAGDVVAEPGRRSGSAGAATWELTYHDDRPPLFTFPRIAWRREWFPSAQIVPAPTASFRGTVALGGRVLELDGAPGGVAHIYGHGNAERWGWLHADLGDGDVLEVVAAVSRRPGLRRLPPLPFVRLRHGGVDWPRFGILGALAGSAHLGLPEWDVTVRSGGRRLRVQVVQPAEHTAVVEYADPDGAPATCRNSERADAEIVLERRSSGIWVVERQWLLDSTAHAEIGSRP